MSEREPALLGVPSGPPGAPSPGQDARPHGGGVMSDPGAQPGPGYPQGVAPGRGQLPGNTKAYLFTTARNHLINSALPPQIVSFDLVAHLETSIVVVDAVTPDRLLTARDELRRVQERGAVDDAEFVPADDEAFVRPADAQPVVEVTRSEVAAARLRVGADLYRRRETPPWIVRLAATRAYLPLPY